MLLSTDYDVCMETDEKITWLSRHITLHNYDNAMAERANALSHAFGAIASFFYTIAILIYSGQHQSFAPPWALAVHGISMLSLYSCSAIYHALPKNDAKRVFRVLDHANIYILIAGTYTPVLFATGSPMAMKVVLVVWVIAVAGIVVSLLLWDKFKLLHVLFYIAMGWLIVAFWNDTIPFLPIGLLYWILGGGIVYTGGTFLYAAKRMKHYHLAWHVACIVASTLFCVGFVLYLA